MGLPSYGDQIPVSEWVIPSESAFRQTTPLASVQMAPRYSLVVQAEQRNSGTAKLVSYEANLLAIPTKCIQLRSARMDEGC